MKADVPRQKKPAETATSVLRALSQRQTNNVYRNSNES
jgi:hypothetical protein